MKQKCIQTKMNESSLLHYTVLKTILKKRNKLLDASVGPEEEDCICKIRSHGGAIFTQN